MIEQYQFLQKTCMVLAPACTILAVLFGFGYNHYGLKVKELEQQTKQKTEKPIPIKNTQTINNFQIKGDYINGEKKEIKSEVINAPNALIVTNRQSGGENIVNYYQNEFKAPNSEIDNLLFSNIENLIKKYPNPPLTIIEIESGNFQRDKVAIQLKTYLSRSNLGEYQQGNINSQKCPNYPVTIMFNAENKQYVNALINSIEPYFEAKYNLRELPTLPIDRIKLYINGQPLFGPSGKVKIE